MNNLLDPYLDLVKKIISTGNDRKDRTGVGTRSIFGAQMTFNLQKGFPLLTQKKVNFQTVVRELLWFLSGNTNIKVLVDQGIKIWNNWADENYDLGPIYGSQWRNWINKNGKSFDQIKILEDNLKRTPYSRRHIVSAWNVGDLDAMALPPCHAFWQVYISGDNKLSLQLYQRSADMFLGVPFNIACYSIIAHMLAHVLQIEVGEFIHTVGDAHVYLNHFKQCERMLANKSMLAPELIIHGKHNSILDIKEEDLELIGYKSHAFISACVAI